MSEASIIDTTFHSVGFPIKDVKSVLPRTNYLSQIDELIKNENDIIFIEGEVDSGKTTLAAQFSKIEHKSTVSIFFNPHNDLDFEVQFFCSNFVQQVSFLLDIGDADNEYIGKEEFQSTLYPIRKKLKKLNKRLNIVVDGLEERLESDKEKVKKILSTIPFNEKIFTIILSGNKDDFLKIKPDLAKLEQDKITLSGFSEPEMKAYLELDKNSVLDVRELYSVTKGLPGRLRTLKNLLKSETQAEELLAKNASYNNWIELDCNSIDLNKSEYNTILSLLALHDKSYTIEELIKICLVTEEDIRGLIDKYRLLEFNGKNVKIISSKHKDYLANILKGNSKKVDELLITYLASSDDVSSLIELPKLLADTQKWSQIIDTLNQDYLPKIIENTGSLKIVNDSLKIGIEASDRLNNHSRLWRYSIEGSIVNELDNFVNWESEIEARIALSDFEGAIALAESAVLNIDRLRLLALIAKRQKEINKLVDEELVSLIFDLYKSTDLISVGNKIYSIVSDLLYAIPNLAIEIIENSSNTESDQDINDWIITKLSFAAIDSSQNDENKTDKTKKLEALESINAPLVKKLNKAISFLVGNYSTSKVIEEVKKLTDSKERLRLLRLWLNNNKRDITGIEKVIEMALDEAIEASSKQYLSQDLLKELSQQLPSIKDLEKKKELLKKFTSLKDDKSKHGLTKNKIIFQLNIFHTNFTIDKRGTLKAIRDIVSRIDKIDDKLIKLDCFAEVYAKLYVLRSNQEVVSIFKYSYKRILELIDLLFNESASHFKISESILEVIGKRNPALGLKICERINTQDRREKAKTVLFESYMENNIRYININMVRKIFDAFDNNDGKQEAIISLLERYDEVKTPNDKQVQHLFFYTQFMDESKSISRKLYSQVLFYRVINKNVNYKGKIAKQQEEKIYTTWKKIEAEWDIIDRGYLISRDLAEFNKEFSKKVFDEVEKIKSNNWINSRLVADAYVSNLRIIIRSYSGLLANDEEKDSHFGVLEKLISRVPSNFDKINIWTDIGFQCIKYEKENIAKKILENYILKIIYSIDLNGYSLETLHETILFIHLYNHTIATNFIKHFSENSKDSFYHDLCYYHITKRSPYEFYEESVSKYKCDFNDISNAIGALKLINTDYHINYNIKHISKAIISLKNTFTKPQIVTVVQELENVVNSKLPDQKNIKHSGYVILCKINIALISKNISHQTYWNDLLLKANEISNTSDKILIKSILLENIPFSRISGSNDLKNQIFSSIINELNSLGSHYEFIQRVNDISETMFNIKRTEWKPIVSKAYNLSNDLEDGVQTYESQKGIIQAMYKLEPEFAKELVSSNKKKTSNKRVQGLLDDYYKSLKLADNIKDNKEVTEENSRIILQAVMSALKALNSDRASSKKASEVIKYLKLAKNLGIFEVLPVYFYYLENCTKRSSFKKEENRSFFDDIFNEAVKASDLIQLLSYKRKKKGFLTRQNYIEKEFSSNRAIKPGSREEAYRFIQDWLEENQPLSLIIVDPYFEASDLEILKTIKEVCLSEIEIQILGSVNGSDEEVEKEFNNHWRKISSQTPPTTEVLFYWLPDEKKVPPFHDRWIISDKGGMRLGTSFNSLGVKKDSEISVMKLSESSNIKTEILDEYLYRKKKTINNQKLKYRMFNL